MEKIELQTEYQVKTNEALSFLKLTQDFYTLTEEKIKELCEKIIEQLTNSTNSDQEYAAISCIEKYNAIIKSELFLNLILQHKKPTSKYEAKLFASILSKFCSEDFKHRAIEIENYFFENFLENFNKELDLSNQETNDKENNIFIKLTCEILAVSQSDRLYELVKSKIIENPQYLKLLKEHLLLASTNKFTDLIDLMKKLEEQKILVDDVKEIKNDIIDRIFYYLNNLDEINETQKKYLVQIESLLINHDISYGFLTNSYSRLQFLDKFFPDLFEKVLVKKSDFFNKHSSIYQQFFINLIFSRLEKYGEIETKEFLNRIHYLNKDNVEACIFLHNLDIKNNAGLDFKNLKKLNQNKNMFSNICDQLLRRGFVSETWEYFSNYLKNNVFFDPDNLYNNRASDVYYHLINFLYLDPNKTFKFIMANQNIINKDKKYFFDFLKQSIRLGLENKVWLYIKHSARIENKFTAEQIVELLSNIIIKDQSLLIKIRIWLDKLQNSKYKDTIKNNLSFDINQISQIRDEKKSMLVEIEQNKRNNLKKLSETHTPYLFEIGDKLRNISKNYNNEKYREVNNIILEIYELNKLSKESIYTTLRELTFPQAMMLNVIGNNFNLANRSHEIKNTKEQRITIEKTGSEAKIWSNGYLEHVIPTSSFKLWLRMQDNYSIPVAPIISYKNKTENLTKVVSRYCGLSLFQTRSIIPMEASDFWKEVYRQTYYIRGKLKELKVDHNHPHESNFTLEYVKSEKYEEYLKNQNESFVNGHISFDPEDYIKNPSKWIMVVRLIDWDDAYEY